MAKTRLLTRRVITDGFYSGIFLSAQPRAMT
jgi:hypothetical protein